MDGVVKPSRPSTATPPILQYLPIFYLLVWALSFGWIQLSLLKQEWCHSFTCLVMEISAYEASFIAVINTGV
jgi:hypothetical protein